MVRNATETTLKLFWVAGMVGMQQNQVESNRINLETYFGGPNPFWLDLRGGRIQKNPKESILN